MSAFAGCKDIRKIKNWLPTFGAEAGIGVIIQGGLSVGESICDECSYVIPEGVHIEKDLQEVTK